MAYFTVQPTTTDTSFVPGGYKQQTNTASKGFSDLTQRQEQTGEAQSLLTGKSAAGTAETAEQRKTREQQEALAIQMREGGAQATTAVQQSALAKALMAQASGTQPGAGQLQLQRALQAQQAATASSIGSQRGMNQATAQRMMAQQQSAQQSAMAGQSAQVALDEQSQARQALGQLLGTQRGQDIQASTAEGQLLAAIRSGDTDAIQAATAAAQAERQGDIQAQAQQLGLYNASGQLDMEAAKMKMEAAMADTDRRFKAGLINAEQKTAEENHVRDFWEKLITAGVGAALGAGSEIVTTLAAGGADKTKNKANGGRIDGSALKPGDHYSNDIVPAMLSPGEIVLPRSIAHADNAPEKAKKFVEALQKLEGNPLSRKSAAARIMQLEAEIAALRSMHATKGNK
jgi:hypothetical protein